MIDTVVLYLPWTQAGGVKYSDIAARIQLTQTFAPAEEGGRRECVKAEGRACGMRVKLDAGGILIGDSLCKSSLHNNFDALTPKQIAEAIAALSDAMGVNLRPAHVCQLDYGITLPVSVAAANVLEACGEVTRYVRKPIGEPLECVQYGDTGKRCVLYNKQLEAKRYAKDGDIIPATWAGVEAVRCEVQLPNSQAIKFVFGRALTAADLCSCEVQKTMAGNWLKWVDAVYLRPKQNASNMANVAELLRSAVCESKPINYKDVATALTSVVLAAFPSVRAEAEQWAAAAENRTERYRFRAALRSAVDEGRKMLCTEYFPAPAPAISAEQIAEQFKASARAVAERWAAQIGN